MVLLPFFSLSSSFRLYFVSHICFCLLWCVFYFFLYPVALSCSEMVCGAGFGRSTAKESWVDKYKPCTFEELAVHKKKVDPVCSIFVYETQGHDIDYSLIVG